MTKDQIFNRVYAALVEHCAAPADELSRMSFFVAFRKEHPTTEYRFHGALGFGGKFRFPGFTVDCYREDETPERLRMIAKANEVLAGLRHEFANATDTVEPLENILDIDKLTGSDPA